MKVETLKKVCMAAVGLLLTAGMSMTIGAQTRGGVRAGGPTPGAGVRTVSGPAAPRGGMIIVPTERNVRVPEIDRMRRVDVDRTGSERERAAAERREATRRAETKHRDDEANRFQKLGRFLDVDPERLQNAFLSAKTVNPDLRLSEFFAAEVIANRLHGSNPSVTSQAILRGIDSGMSLERTLVSLGTRPDEAQAAVDWAKRIVNHLKP